ncbi:uncharacterized protein LOC118187137 isoform X2 [Stegodyphus dumicola]|uniref:uncharacterized protein LOC118187137 isoform X2 n=1 Tax=Stegodyphus dumicola TaxID=202533 RepID=UPI0015B174A0|nr:uncharacterized protein LOC118187137 isoform X2 [Stegodyphus dumicola]
MAVLKTCCFYNSVRDGSFACGIYTMIFYTLVVTVGTFHLDPSIENKVLFAFGLTALCLSGMCVMSSALLLVGLCADNRTFLIPWLVCISMTTLLDIFLSFYFIAEDSEDPFLAILFVTDFLICGLNIYCLLVVISQYQEYAAGRGRPEDCIRMEPQPEVRCMRFNWPSFQVLNQEQLEATEAAAKAESQTDAFLNVPGQSSTRIECHNSHDSVGSTASTRLIVEICRNDSFKNTPSVRSAETEELPGGV